MDLRTAFGVLAGLVLSFAAALIIVVVHNGAKNPGVEPVQAIESAAGGASAPLPGPGVQSPFDGLDVNGDGKLSLAEAAGYGDVVTRFHRVDRNKDGRLTKAEFERLAKLPPAKERPKPRLRLREDAAASLAAAREGQ
jgi:EF hand